MADPVFTVGGLATGMDTQSMIDKLVALESQPLTLLKKHESGFKAQVSALGDITSKLSALRTAAQNLADSGVLGLKATSTNSSFSATPGSSAVAGSYDVQVQQLATPAKWRSAAIGAADQVKGGTLTITPSSGTPISITVTDGMSVENLASAIRNSGAPVSAVVLSDDAGKHLSLKSYATGSAAPTISFSETGSTGASLGLQPIERWESAAFGSGDTVKGGTLNVTASDGTPFAITIPDGKSLQEAVDAINAGGAPISAVVIKDTQGAHLSITGTGGDTPTVSFVEDATPTGTKSFGLQSKQASDAIFSVDGLTFTRSSNTVTDALPGVTLQLTSAGGATGPTETLSIENDTDATKANLQAFVDAYNGVMQLVQKQLNVTEATDRASTLAGDPVVRMLQQSLQKLGSSIVGSSSVRSLADLGLATQRDGTLSIDSTTLAAAIGRDPNAVNKIFSDPTSGISKLAYYLVDSFSGPTGLLVMRQNGLNKQIEQMDDQAADMQTRIDTYRQTLMQQFTAMENVVSQYKTIGTFLTQQSNSSSK
jgi:flagellar hook-associated protein 2